MSWGERSCKRYGSCVHNPTSLTCNVDCEWYVSNGTTPDSVSSSTRCDVDHAQLLNEKHDLEARLDAAERRARVLERALEKCHTCYWILRSDSDDDPETIFHMSDWINQAEVEEENK